MNPTTPDPVIDEIRAIRHQISEMCEHDARKLVAYFQEVQRQYSDRLLSLPQRAEDDTDPLAAVAGSQSTGTLAEA